MSTRRIAKLQNIITALQAKLAANNTAIAAHNATLSNEQRARSEERALLTKQVRGLEGELAAMHTKEVVQA